MREKGGGCNAQRLHVRGPQIDLPGDRAKMGGAAARLLPPPTASTLYGRQKAYVIKALGRLVRFLCVYYGGLCKR
jgi:hypothetical protein